MAINLHGPLHWPAKKAANHNASSILRDMRAVDS
jgi:hypothetical protein